MPKKHNLTYTEKIIISSVVFGIIVFTGLLYKFPTFRSIFTETIPNATQKTYNNISLGLSLFMSDLYKDTNLMKSYLTYSIVYGLIIIATIFFYLYNTDKYLFSNKTFVSNVSMLFMFFVIGLLIKVMFLTSTYKPGENMTNNYNIVYGAIALMTISIILYSVYSYLSKETLLLVSNIFMIFLLLGLTAALAMFFIIFNNSLKLLTGWSGFLVYFIFYIPCLLISLIEYIKGEFKSTTNTIFILFILEICFILSYLYLPKILNLYLNKGGKVLLDDSRFLDKEYTLASGSELKIKDKHAQLVAGVEKTSKSSDQNFSLSMWVYINTQPPSDGTYAKESNIFHYYNENSNSNYKKPQIVYNYHAKTNKINNFKIYFTNDEVDGIKNYYEFAMPEQKWNNLVINYNSDIVDLFVNGNLATSFKFAPNYKMPNYNNSDIIKIGSNDGLYGSICNIRYYHHPLSKSEIVNHYNLLVFKNPPINTI
jgi:hypothetical protein